MWPDRYTRMKTEDSKPAIHKLEQQVLPHRHPITYRKSQILLRARSLLKRLKPPMLFKAFPGDLKYRSNDSFKVLPVV